MITCTTASVELEEWKMKGPALGVEQALHLVGEDPGKRVAFPGKDWACELPQANTLVRVRVLFTPPANGPYRFAIAGDDLVTLEISEDGLPFRKRLVAKLDSYCGPNDWHGRPGQISDPIELDQGKSCYLEVNCLNQGGAGHFEVGWMKPGTDQVVPLPLDEALTSSYTAPPADTDDDGLPDEWERTEGLEIGKNTVHGGLGDPDGDGMNNRREFLDGTRPLTGESAPERVLTEVWPSSGNTGLEQLFSFGIHHQARPAAIVTLEKDVAVAPFPLPGFQRTRGFIVPPASGTYRFDLRGQGIVSLSLAPDGDAMHKRRVIRGGTILAESAPATSPSDLFPPSEPIILEKDRPCYFEITLYQQRGPYFLEFRWTPPANDTQQVPASALRSYVSPFPDDDLDGLPDDWERANSIAVDGAIAAHFAEGDPDFDGADNQAEYLAKSDPLKADSDGDGVNDGMEINVLGSDPLAGPSPLGEPIKVDLFSAKALTAGWSRAEPRDYEKLSHADPPLPDLTRPSLSHYQGCGVLEWKFQVSRPGFHAISIPVQPVIPNLNVEVGVRGRFWIDGHRLPDAVSFRHAVAVQNLETITPYLKAGEHTLKLKLAPTYMPTVTRIFGFEICPVNDPSSTEARLSDMNRFTAGSGGSRISPATVEFRSRIAEPLTLLVGDRKIPLKRLGATNGWAEVDLPASGELLDLTVRTEDGALTSKATANWVTTNVLVDDDLVIRVGDSLRLGAGQEAATLDLAGEQRELQSGEAWTRRFTKPGKWQVTCRSGGRLGTLHVTVRDNPDLPEVAFGGLGHGTNLPKIPEGFALDGLDIARIRKKAGTSAIFPQSAGNFTLPVRLIGSDAITGTMKLQVSGISSADQAYFGAPDGRVPMGRTVHILIENAPPDAMLRLVCRNTEDYLPFDTTHGTEVRIPVSAIGTDGAATIHLRMLKNLDIWPVYDVHLTLPDGSEW